MQQADVSAKKLIDEVRKLSEGNFLYTRLVMNGISTGELSLKNLSALPKNLYEVYQRFLRHRCPVRKWVHLYQPILGTLTVTQEAISTAQLTKFARIASKQIEGEAQVESAIGILRQFLDEVEDEQGQKLYTIFHQSLREYLLDRKRNHDFWCHAKEQHDHIIQCCEQESQNWQDLRAIDLYGLRHLTQHMVQGNQLDKLHDLLSLERSDNNTWFAVKDERGQLPELVEDIRLAWTAAIQKFEAEPGKAIALQCRYAILTPTISKLNSALPTPLLISLVKEKKWSVERALGYALFKAEESEIEEIAASRVEKITALADLLPEILKQQTLQVCLDTVEAVNDSFVRARLLCQLSEKFPQVYSLSYSTAESIQDAWYRACALSALSEKFPELSDQALKAVQVAIYLKERGHYFESFAAFLVPIAKRLPEGIPYDALASAYAIQCSFGNSSVNYVLRRLCKRFPAVVPQILNTVQIIQLESRDVIVYRTTIELMYGDRYAARFLEELAQELPQDLLPYALKIVQASEDSVSTAIASTALAKRFPQVIPHALDAIQKIPSDWGGDNWFDRALFLVQIVEQTPENLLPRILEITQEIQQEKRRNFVMVRIAKQFPQIFAETLDQIRKTSKKTDPIRLNRK